MLCLGVLCQAAPAKNYNLTSPDGKLKVDVSVGDNITWSLNHIEDALIVDSPISMTLSDGVVYGDGDKVTKEAAEAWMLHWRLMSTRKAMSRMLSMR